MAETVNGDTSNVASEPQARPRAHRSMFFPQIDVLRGFAAISVVVYHCIAHFEWTDFPIQGPLLWFRLGWMGVDLFFVISGFVIALAAFSGIDREGPRGFRRGFMWRRFLRIAPLHYLTCLLFVALVTPEIATRFNIVENLLYHLTFLHNTDWRWAGSINGPNWSIGVEMQFYLLMMLVAPLLRGCKWWVIPVAAILIAWSWRLGACLRVPIDETTGPYLRFWASTQLPGTLDQFAVGILLARFFRAVELAPLQKLLTRYWWAVAAGAAVFFAIVLAIYWPWAAFWAFPAMVVVWRTLLAIAFGLVILVACLLNNPILVRVTAPLRYFGTISYGIYLWHLSVILSVKRIEGLSHEEQLGLVLVLTFLLATCSWYFFERRYVRLSAK